MLSRSQLFTTHVMRDASAQAALPSYLRELPDSVGEIALGGRELHVGVRSKQGVRFYVVFDVSHNEQRIRAFGWSLLLGVVIAMVVTTVLGCWMAGLVLQTTAESVLVLQSLNASVSVLGGNLLFYVSPRRRYRLPASHCCNNSPSTVYDTWTDMSYYVICDNSVFLTLCNPPKRGTMDQSVRPKPLDCTAPGVTLSRFVPVAVDDLVVHLAENSRWDAVNTDLFSRVCRMLVALYHAQFHDKLQNAKRNYLPFSPDRDTLMVQSFSPEQRTQALSEFMTTIKQVLQRANFDEISIETVNSVLNKRSPYGVEVTADLGEFEEIALFYRDVDVRIGHQRRWQSAFLKKYDVEVPLYRRLFVLLKPHDKQQVEADSDSVKSNCVYLKLFKDIPQLDLEMLFPNTRVRMSLFDKIKIGLTGGGGTVSGIVAMVSKLTAAALTPITLIIAFGGFAVVIWRQIANVFSHHNKYMAQLTRNLYFYNLNNNMGAIVHLIDLAEAEDCKEALLAYYFLSVDTNIEYTREMLDKEIELYFQQHFGICMDFDVDDGVRKLGELGLLTVTPEGVLRVSALEPALLQLNVLWDEMYKPFLS